MKKYIFLIIFTVLFSAFTKPAHALSARMDYFVKGAIDPQMALEKTVFESVKNQIAATACLALSSGCVDSDTNEPLLEEQGAVEFGTNAVAYLISTPPAQTKTYVADVLQNTRLAPPAYAQGIGFSALNPVLQIWKAFRNFAYFLFVIVFVVIGFMIMFRAKLNPQTVINIQTALPKLIITMILITFSYAIAGFVIDLLFLFIYLFVGLFKTFEIFEPGSPINDLLLGENIFNLAWKHLLGWQDATGNASRAVHDIIFNIYGQTTASNIAGEVSQILVYAIFAIAILVAVFQTFFILLSSYVAIILSVILAPIQLVLNAFPGSQAFGTWLKSLIANAAVFPAVALFILIGVALTGAEGSNEFQVTGKVGFEQSNDGEGGFAPPFILTQADSSATMDALIGIIGLGFLMLIPRAAKLVKDTIMGQDQSPVGSLTGAALGSFGTAGKWAGAPVRFGVGEVWRQHQATEATRKSGEAIATKFHELQRK